MSENEKIEKTGADLEAAQAPAKPAKAVNFAKNKMVEDISKKFAISSTILFPIRIHILQSDELRPEMFYILVIFS